jgi:hypothetical protein
MYRNRSISSRATFPDNYAAKYAEQGEPVLPESKRISAEGIADGSPVAPPKAAGGTSDAATAREGR